MPHSQPLTGGIQFLRQYVRSPRTVGAVAPSSSALAAAMLETVDWEQEKVVVEIGPGTGAFTKAILTRLTSDAKFFTMEINPQFVTALQGQFPQLTVYQQSVAQIADVCSQERVRQADAIVSGLPWASFSDARQTEFLEALTSVLKKGGYFATFAYVQGLWLPSGRRFKRKLAEYFREVTSSPTVWRNLPPAFVYRCRK